MIETKDIREYAEMLMMDGYAEEFLRFIIQVRDGETKEVLQNEKIEHVKSVKAIERILAKLPELKKRC